ncbi:hypothetical protein [Phenylobacterium montanum]|uniref:Lipoprotein n=1 Tax=Phenylobacterium montanum TaxID=2823693 RepID=A0A975G3W4_9CAUL|nr:hypothetical protein [Caulobacter sp. S6]QUD90098.1 hypothetical protein KCG34_09630 [Caulobacter sp. S6]
MKPTLPTGLIRHCLPLFSLMGLLALADCAPPPSGPPTPAQTQAFVSQADTAIRAMQACDKAADRALAASGAISYDGSLNAESECYKTANTLVNFRFGQEVGQQFQKPLDAAVADCWSAYDAKTHGLEKLAMTANATTAPNAGPAPDFGAINGKARACLAGLQQRANSLGFKATLDDQGD